MAPYFDREREMRNKSSYLNEKRSGTSARLASAGETQGLEASV